MEKVLSDKGAEDNEDEKKKMPPLMVVADIECPIEHNVEGRNVFVADLIRYATEDDPQNVSYAFSGDTCIEQFINKLIDLTEVAGKEKQRDLLVMFHNLKGFDSNYIIKELYRQGIKVENQLTNGAKTLTFDYRYIDATITFKDSLCFLPMPLADLPETFNLKELHKGFFPHAFHTRENLGYKGPLPDKQYFQPQAMKEKKRKEFNTWYATQVEKNELYELWEELNKYCHSDIMVLKAACYKFIQEFKEEARINPMEKCATIASACNLFWRQELLPEDTIAIEALDGWRGNQVNQSKVAPEWLCYEDWKLGGNRLRHVRNGGEQKVFTPAEAVFVDGYDEMTKTAYEFHGCFYHGCRQCFPNQRQKTRNCHPDRTVEEKYEATLKKTAILGAAGYTVIEKWECQFENEKKADKQLQDFLKTFELVESLNPRDAFFGGRTNAVCHHVKTKESESIQYNYINSLYPFVNKTKTYPVGHPEIFTHPTDQNIGNYFGVAKVKLLVPPSQYHPVLPVRANGKLTFPLCGQCVKEELENHG